jgi:heme/copper-type cytochrome/quinol oxidase subunit 2
MTTSRQWLYLSIAFAFVLIATSALLPMPWFGGKTVIEEVTSETQAEKTFHLITTEYKTTVNGKEMEVYRWNPGNLVVREGDQVKLVMHGVHGKVHHFSLKEFGLQGTVKKGKATTVRFVADKPGTYELICHNHHGVDQNGPMVAYITVLPEKK